MYTPPSFRTPSSSNTKTASLMMILCFSLVIPFLGWADPSEMSDDNAVSGTTASPPTGQDLSNFLAQNPQVATEAAAALNGQPTPPPSSTTPPPTASPDPAANPWQSQDPALQNARSSGFQAVANQAFPLTPEQIKTLNNMMDATQRAQAEAPNDSPPQPTSTSLFVSLAPGTTPPVIRLAKGFVSSLVFIDSSGAAWPIEAYDIGNPTAFNLTWDKKSNTLMVQAKAAYTYGNLAVKLKNLDTPVMLTLVPGQKIVDYRVDLRIQGIGPEAKADAIQTMGMPEQADNILLNVLDGVPPSGAKRLSTTSGIVQVWEVDNKVFYLRTAFTLISPAWLSRMSSADGMNAYKLPLTPILLVSRYGKVEQVKVEGL